MDKKTIEVLIELIGILCDADTNDMHEHTHGTFDGHDKQRLRELELELRKLDP